MGRNRGRAWGGKKGAGRKARPGGPATQGGGGAGQAAGGKPPRWCPASAYPPRPPGVCRFCLGKVPKGRISWCSEACVQEYLALRSPAGLRRMVWNRDKGVCRVCRMDCTALECIIQRWRRTAVLKPLALQVRTDLGVLSRKAYWDADHVIAVRDGGGSCGTQNIQTVCVWCHRRKNAEELDIKLGKPPADPRRPAGVEIVAAVMGPAKAEAIRLRGA